jgi:RHS repeat-associated protein
VFSAGDYRYGFNGKDKDVEVSGVGNHQNYGLRIYFPRLARFLSVDPWTKNYPVLTPYQFASNLPIAAIDLDGAEAQRVVEGSVIHGPMDIRVVNEKRIKSNPGLIFNPLPSSNHTFLYNNPQPPSSQGGGCDYCDKIEPYKEVPDPVRKANAANRAVKEYKAKADPLFFGNKNPASNNPIGLVPGINTGATQVPMLLFEEYVFAKAYNFFSKPPMEWGAFRSANKDVFKGPNHMKEASQALKKYKQYNQNVETALNYADLILTVQGLLDGSAESADEATSGSGSSSGISIPNTQAVLDATKLGPKKQ